MNKKLFVVVGILALCVVIALPGPAMAQKKRFFGIATGGIGGVYYPVGGALAQALTNTIPDLAVTAHTGNASVANVNLISRGEVESGISQITLLWQLILETRNPGKLPRSKACAASLPYSPKRSTPASSKNRGLNQSMT